MPMMVPVVSSNLSAVGYDEVAGTLYVEFLSGSRYAYYGVPAETYRGLVSADSKGRYLHRFIKGAYAYRRIW